MRRQGGGKTSPFINYISNSLFTVKHFMPYTLAVAK